MTDTEFMLHVLKQGPVSTMDLISASIRERHCGLTPHSRAADLRRDGHDVRCELVGPDERGRPVYEYSLIQHPVQLELSA